MRASKSQKSNGGRQSAAVVILAVLCLFVLLVCAGTGSVFISAKEALAILVYQLTGRGDVSEIDPSTISILWAIRLPRVAAN